MHCFIMFSVFFFSLIPLFLILPSFGLLEFFFDISSIFEFRGLCIVLAVFALGIAIYT